MWLSLLITFKVASHEPLRVESLLLLVWTETGMVAWRSIPLALGDERRGPPMWPTDALRVRLTSYHVPSPGPAGLN